MQTFCEQCDISKVEYSVHKTPVGHCLIATTSGCISFASLGDSREELIQEMQKYFPEDTSYKKTSASLHPDPVSVLLGENIETTIFLQGTEFQKRVWKEVSRIPRGEVRTYREVAEKLGNVGLARAVGTALGKNTVAIFVPCHRVVGANQKVGKFRWGSRSKEKMLEIERSS